MNSLRSTALHWLCRVALAGVVVAVAGCGDPGYDPRVAIDPPSTDEERAAARVAVNFATLLQRGQPREACGFARGAARRELRCSHTRRIPRGLRIPQRRRIEVIDLTPAEVSGAIRLGILPGDPVLAVEVDRSGYVVYVTHYGYA